MTRDMGHGTWDKPSLWWRVALSLLAVLTCLLHYFGIIALGLVVAGHLLSDPRPWREKGRILWWLVPGLVALLACVPMYLGQQAATGGVTWVEPVRFWPVKRFLESLLPPLVIWAGALAWWLGRIGEGKGGAQEASQETAQSPDGSIAPSRAATHALSALWLMPLALVVLSYALQPVLFDRYSIPTIAAMGPVFAGLLAGARRMVQVVFVGVVVLIGMMHLYPLAADFHWRDQEWRDMTRTLTEELPGQRVLFEIRHDLYPMAELAMKRQAMFFVYDFPDEEENWDLPKKRLERNVARAHQRLYGFPQMLSKEEVIQSAPLYYVSEQPDEERVKRLFPYLEVRAIQGRIFELRGKGEGGKGS